MGCNDLQLVEVRSKMKKIVIVVAMLFIFTGVTACSEKGDASYKPCVYVSGAVYWDDEYMTVEQFEQIPTEQLLKVGITKEVTGRLPEKQGEAVWESGKEIIYDSVNDCVYIYYELSEPRTENEQLMEPETVNERGYVILRKIDE